MNHSTANERLTDDDRVELGYIRVGASNESLSTAIIPHPIRQQHQPPNILVSGLIFLFLLVSLVVLFTITFPSQISLDHLKYTMTIQFGTKNVFSGRPDQAGHHPSAKSPPSQMKPSMSSQQTGYLHGSSHAPAAPWTSGHTVFRVTDSVAGKGHIDGSRHYR